MQFRQTRVLRIQVRAQDRAANVHALQMSVQQAGHALQADCALRLEESRILTSSL